MGRIVELLKLRDSVWQGIGGIVAIASITISVFVAYDVYQRSVSLPIIEVTTEDGFGSELPFVGKELAPRVKIVVDGVERNSLHFIRSSISNTGNAAVKPEDYIEPISVKVKQPWNLIAAEASYSEPQNINIKWTKVTSDTYMMTPILLNPGDSIGVNFIAVLPPLEVPPDEPPTIEWNGRITNVKSLNAVNPFDSAVPVGISIIHGWDARFFALVILTSILLFSILVAVNNGRLPKMTIKETILLLVLCAFGFVMMQILFFIRFLSGPRMGELYIGLANWVFIGCYISLIVYLAWPNLLKAIQRLRSRNL